MSAAAVRPRLAVGIAAALVASLAGAALLAALTPLLGTGTALRAAAAAVGLGYVLFLLGQSNERVGRVTTVAVWAAVTLVAWLGGLPAAGFVPLQLASVWLVRSLYAYEGVLPALADLGLTLLGAAFGAWALARSGSPFLALWCFFLVQACCAWLPRSITQQTARETPAAGERADFERARRAAEAALQRLAASR